MNESTLESRELSHDDMLSALFAQMVMQQSNMAMMLLGKTPHPQTGETLRDLEAARLFIDQLEMLEVKTRGNLNKDEENLLKQSLMALRMAFVEAVDSDARPAPSAAQRAQPDAAAAPHPQQDNEAAETESKKKFTKKY